MEYSLGKRVAVALFYGFASFSIVISNKFVLTSFHFPSFQVLAFGQMTASILVLGTGSVLGLVDIPGFSADLPRKLWPLPAIYAGNLIFGLGATQRISLPMFTVLRRFSILMTMLGEYIILHKKPSNSVQIAVYAMVAGAIIAGSSDLAFDMLGYTWIMLGNMFTALGNVYSRKKMDMNHVGKNGLVFYNAAFMILPSALICASYGDFEKVAKFDNWTSLPFLSCFLASCFMGFVLNYATMLCTQVNSPLTTTVVGCLKNLFVTYAGMVIGGDYIFSYSNFFGLNVSVAGSLLYTYVTFRGPTQSTSSKSADQKPLLPLSNSASPRDKPGDTPNGVKNVMTEKSYVLALDIGTTSVRCIVYDQQLKVTSHNSLPMTLLYPSQGRVEIDPNDLWEKVIRVIKLATADIDLEKVAALGICTQRNTFTTWDRVTGKTFHNFITWQDLRADSLVRSWNNSLTFKVKNSSLTFKCMHGFGRLAHALTGIPKFKAASVVKITNPQVLPRLVWALENVPALGEAVKVKRALYGSIETWLTWKLTNGKVHATDYSCASATCFFDPFTCSYAAWAINLFRLPRSILPEIRETVGDFGAVDVDIFGAEIPIRCLIGDQSASLFGSGCLERGDMKLTLGTGGFMNVTTGKVPHTSVAGVYPLIAWKRDGEVTYMAEGAVSDMGTVMEWSLSVGLLEDVRTSATLARSIPDSDGVFFIPSFNGLQAPVNDPTASAGFIGIKATSSRAHLVRAQLESIAFRLVQLVGVMKKEADFPIVKIRVDGGVSQNDFVMEILSSLCEVTLERQVDSERSALGTGLFLGLSQSTLSSVPRSVDEVELVLLMILADIFFNTFAEILGSKNVHFLIMYIAQDTILVFSLITVFLTFANTYIFQAGMISELLFQFKVPLAITSLYLVASIAFHSTTLNARWNNTEAYFWTPAISAGFVVHRILATLHYTSYKRTALRIADPRFYAPPAMSTTQPE
ncbi:unnamed protein product [Cyprideis torosa]|uniref:Glycerol kinase 5 n=1 Tax=Cyprideis torosa TaxID=163714 RepID=A0A7R8WD55_9CRUS|nr:unnamed protein product [Cyprideis torosa]CAG0888213.1 unnamed protein product [Cyprideis torosa]